MVPEFLVLPQRVYDDWWGSIRLLCSRVASSSSRYSSYPLSGVAIGPFRLSSRSLAVSSLAHGSLLIFLLYLPWLVPDKAAPQHTESYRSETIFYRLPPASPFTRLPRIAPQGIGARPGSGSLPFLDPVRGRTASYGDVTIISKPERPDNARQTIIQPSSPPDLRIQTELKLPNIVLGDPTAPKKPRIATEMAKPRQQNGQVAEVGAPTLTPVNPDIPLNTFERANSAPRLPVQGLSAPARRDTGFGADNAADAPDVGGAQAGSALMVLGVDPAEQGSQLAIPPGNRFGEFSISGGEGVTGTPGGTVEGHLNGGTGGSKGGGDEISTGVGPGNRGGGGGSAGSTGPVSISGSAGKGEGPGLLDPKFIANMVYPVISAVKIRRNPMVVSAGPIGGGGLDVYGTLKCERIYTIFLPMPRASWTMQYCQKGSTAPQPKAQAQSTVIRLESGLVPPDPDTDTRFDFRRLPVPLEKAQKMIVLKGMLKEDGTVSDLTIYQSVVPAMDEAARIAFSRWKFRPATRDGKPVGVEILVGIPPEDPGAQNSPPTSGSPAR
jgi:hypothetical protein